MLHLDENSTCESKIHTVLALFGLYQLLREKSVHQVVTNCVCLLFAECEQKQ